MSEETAQAEEQSLDELLTEFKEPEVNTEAPKDQSKVDKIYDWMETEKQEKSTVAFETGVTEAVKALKSDEVNASDRALKGFLYTLADENPTFGKAFENRKSNPAAWQRSLEWAKKEAIKDYPASTDKIKDDIEAAKASASTETTTETKGPDNDFWNSLNDVDFRKAKAALAAGKDPVVAVSK